MCRLSGNAGSLNLLEPSEPHRPVYGRRGDRNGQSVLDIVSVTHGRVVGDSLGCSGTCLVRYI
jgi:hypothetical protein